MTRPTAALMLLLVLGSCVAEAPIPDAGVIDHPPDATAPARAGGPLPGLSAAELALFRSAGEAFGETDTVDGHGDTSRGLGPRFNLVSCAGCHGFPAMGGSSSALNPQPLAGKLEGATNEVHLPFLHSDGPVVEVRFRSQMDGNGGIARDAGGARRPDGGVHALFTIAGRSDAGRCVLAQPPFQSAWDQDNISLRIPTPVFGLGLIEAIDESTIMANSLLAMQRAPGMAARVQMMHVLGIAGRPGRGRQNLSGNDGSITRFGWKAQNKSLLLFAGEAYNVEQGVTNELFPNERDGEAEALPADCKLNLTPEDDARLARLGAALPAGSSAGAGFDAVAGDIAKFELFMRLLAPPSPACDLQVSGSCPDNVVRGSEVFDRIYCSACHVRELALGRSSIPAISAQKVARLFSDLLLHRMGHCAQGADHRPRCLADGISQGMAEADEFRTAPLWGVGQRVFFLHDGRARNLPAAIVAHRGPGSEANAVIERYAALPTAAKQDLIDFLRSL